METTTRTHKLFLDSVDRLAEVINPEINVVAGNVANEFTDGSLKKSTLNKVNP